MIKYEAERIDVAVIGAGHAGLEAALASARMGVKTVLLPLRSTLWAICLVIRQSAVRERGISFLK